MTNWFIQQQNEPEDMGPLRPSELLLKVRNGEVTRETMVRKDDSPWFTAGEVGGLFEAAMRPTIEYFCPGCHHEVSEPPVTCPKCGEKVKRGITKITENSIVRRDDQSLTSQAGHSVRKWLQKKRISKDKDGRQ